MRYSVAVVTCERPDCGVEYEAVIDQALEPTDDVVGWLQATGCEACGGNVTLEVRNRAAERRAWR